MSFLYKPSVFAKRALSLMFLTIPAAIDAAVSPPRILDLSEEFPIGNVYTTDAEGFQEFITRDVRRFLIIDDGEIVKEYQRDNINQEDVFELWSATKATMSMFVGTVIYNDDYDLTEDDTLGEIFTDERAWSDIVDPEELAFKQNITILELLTMTSGLIQDIDSTMILSGLSANVMRPVNIPNSAGINIRESLALPDWNATERGNYNYLFTSNILSYVILEVTGMTPFEYVSANVFPALGINTDNVIWQQNHGGMETSFSSLFMTARDMAKVAQLYLQKGLVAPDKRLLSEEFVEASLSEFSFGGVGDLAIWQGYLWTEMPIFTPLFPNTIGEHIWCGMGFLGQGFCFNYESKRVVAFQRSNTIWDVDNQVTLTLMAQAAFSANFTWNETVVQAESGAFSLSLSGVLASVALSCLAFWL